MTSAVSSLLFVVATSLLAAGCGWVIAAWQIRHDERKRQRQYPGELPVRHRGAE